MSSSKAVEVDLGIHVADGEDLKLSYAGDDLVGSFRDWREVLSVFRCVGVIAFRWQPIEYFLEEERPDLDYGSAGVDVDSITMTPPDLPAPPLVKRPIRNAKKA